MKKFPAWFKRGAQLIAVGLSLCATVLAFSGGEPRATDPAATSINNSMTLPIPYGAKYNLVKTGMALAQVTYTLAHTDHGWEYRARAKPAKMMSLLIDGTIDEYSLLEIDNGRVKPIEYQYTQKKDDDKTAKFLHVEYDWENRTATVNNGNDSRKLEITQDTHDPLSMQLALIQQMKNGCRSTHFTVIDELELQKQHFECTATESLSTELGDHKALRISYRKGKRETVTWLAPELNHIPVKIQQFKNNNLNSEMRITAVDFE